MSQVIEMTANYRLITDEQAVVTLESNQRPGIIVSAIHERYGLGPICYDLAAGLQHEQIAVHAGESLTFIARCQGRIIGCLVNEIDCRAISRVLLHPKGGFNLIVYQPRQPDELPLDHQDAAFGVRLLHEPTPTTGCLAELVMATTAYYADIRLPAVLVHALPAVTDAIKANEEAYSQMQIALFCVILDTLGISQEPQIRAAFDAAMAIKP